MRDVSGSLQRKDEIVWRLGCPAGIALRPLQGIKGTIDLDRIESFRRIREFPAVRQVLKKIPRQGA